MTLNSFFKEIQFPKRFLLDMRNYEIDFLFKAAEEYKIDKTKLMYAIVDYREKHRKSIKNKKFFQDVETGEIFKNRKDFFIKNNLSISSAYKHASARLRVLSINDLDSMGVDCFEL